MGQAVPAESAGVNVSSCGEITEAVAAEKRRTKGNLDLHRYGLRSAEQTLEAMHARPEDHRKKIHVDELCQLRLVGKRDEDLVW